MPCRTCVHFLSSIEANKPRWGLEGYGYCKAASTIDLRARIFRDTTVCWLAKPSYQERRP